METYHLPRRIPYDCKPFEPKYSTVKRKQIYPPPPPPNHRKNIYPWLTLTPRLFISPNHIVHKYHTPSPHPTTTTTHHPPQPHLRPTPPRRWLCSALKKCIVCPHSLPDIPTSMICHPPKASLQWTWRKPVGEKLCSLWKYFFCTPISLLATAHKIELLKCIILWNCTPTIKDPGYSFQNQQQQQQQQSISSLFI